MTPLGDRQTLRFASYNIRKAVGLDRRRDPGRILDVLNRLDADVVTLQEADRRLGERPTALPRRLIESETDFELLSVAESDGSIGWHGNAVLLRKGISASKAERLDLPGLEPRGAVRFELDLGRPVTVIGTHLGLVRRHRRRQLEVLAASIPDEQDALIMGDFNEWSENRGLEALGPVFNILSPGHSFHAARPVAALDRIAHSGGIEVTDAGVEQGTLARRASDHLPIWADFCLTGKA